MRTKSIMDSIYHYILEFIEHTRGYTRKTHHISKTGDPKINKTVSGAEIFHQKGKKQPHFFLQAVTQVTSSSIGSVRELWGR